MKALFYLNPGVAEALPADEPKLRPGYVKIRVTYCGICGSDIAIFLGKHPRATAPLILGHEFVGVIEDACEIQSPLHPGDRVVAYPLLSCGHCRPCRTGIPHVCETLGLLGIDQDGGIAEYICVHESSVFRVEEGLSDIAAALVEPLAVVVHALHRAGFQYLDTAAVMGAGPIGLLTAIALRHAGASKIILSDMNLDRVVTCREMGFEAVNIREQSLAEAVQAMTGGEGVDITFECSGTEPATLESTRLTRIGGTICMTGQHKTQPVYNMPEFTFKEQRLIATRVYTKEEFLQAARQAVSIQEELEKVVSNIVALDEAAGVFDMIADPSIPTMKVLIDCR